MSVLFDEMEKQARLLPPQEKARLARILVKDLDPSSDADAEQLWIAEAQRRYEGYRNGTIEARPGPEVMDRVRQRLQ